MSSSAGRVRFFESMVVSSSGWRGVFGEGEESFSTELPLEKLQVITAAAYAVGKTITAIEPAGDVLVATDSRPTGPPLAATVMQTLRGLGITIRYIGVSPTPEVLAYAKAAPGIGGFLILTASHNPVGHNGIKFGLGDGRVVGGTTASGAAMTFEETIRSDELFRLASAALTEGERLGLEKTYGALDTYKAEAEEAYRRKMMEALLRVSPERDGAELLSQLQEGIRREPMGVVIDYNGSARANSIDESFLSSLGVEVKTLHAKPGEIAHRIVPEGSGLDECKAALQEAYQENPIFRIGYAADNDGDRGNLVFIDGESGRAEELHAQEVFALSMVAELAWGELAGLVQPDRNGGAIVVNGPTSLRVDEIARPWGAKVYRSEVGEANVIDRAAVLTGERIVIMGEGSNGGNITPPSQVRDPLSTVGAMIKLSRSDAYSSWFRRLGLTVPEKRDLRRLARALPRYVTTGAYEDRAILQITTQDHGALKRAYEKNLPAAFEDRRAWLRDRCNAVEYRVINYEGIQELPGLGNRSGNERGGFKVEFLDERGVPVAFVWMRGSKTESAFRIMADLRGDDREVEAALLDWHAGLVRRADEVATGGD